ncbi:hypothetical protein NGUA27_03968 [Salmonella enterica]|nr:hypothetical protein NGUA27_03968 [Salmonella enterica]
MSLTNTNPHTVLGSTRIIVPSEILIGVEIDKPPPLTADKVIHCYG